MKRLCVALCLSWVPLVAAAQSSSTTPSGPPTVEEARAFLDHTNAELLALGNEAARAGWVQETYITDDTEAIAAKADERLLTKTNELVIASRRFQGLKMPPEMERQFKLLRLNGSPTDPKLVAEMTQVKAALDGMYGKGKYCPPGKAGEDCL